MSMLSPLFIPCTTVPYQYCFCLVFCYSYMLLCALNQFNSYLSQLEISSQKELGNKNGKLNLFVLELLVFADLSPEQENPIILVINVLRNFKFQSFLQGLTDRHYFQTLVDVSISYLYLTGQHGNSGTSTQIPIKNIIPRLEPKKSQNLYCLPY